MIDSMKKLLILIVLFLFSVSIEAQTVPSGPPGKLVDVGGYKLHINGKGTGDKTLVIETGTGSWSLQWMELQEELAKHFKVVTYDRAGYGWSDPSPYARTGKNIAEELKLGLEKGGFEGPYILLGHSYGGLIVKTFAKQFPEDVEALILADAATAYQFDKLPSMVGMVLEGSKQQFKQAGTMARSGMLSANQMPVDSTLNEAHWSSYQQTLAEASFYDAMLNEMDLLPMTFQASELDEPINMPLLVITAENSFGAFDKIPSMPIEESNKVWMELQKSLLSTSTNSTQKIITGATHDLTLTAQQELVTIILAFIKDL